MALTVTTIEKQSGIFIVSPFGSLDSNTYDILEDKINYLISEGAPKVMMLDMGGMHYISSIGVRVILKAKKDLSRHGATLVMMNLQPQIKKVFEIINALPSFRIFTDIQELDNYLTEIQRRTIEQEQDKPFRS